MSDVPGRVRPQVDGWWSCWSRGDGADIAFSHWWRGRIMRSPSKRSWQLAVYCTSCHKDHCETHMHDDLTAEMTRYAPVLAVEIALSALEKRKAELLRSLNRELCYPLAEQAALAEALYRRVEGAGRYGVLFTELMQWGNDLGHPYFAVEWTLQRMGFAPAGLVALDHRCRLDPHEGVVQAMQ